MVKYIQIGIVSILIILGGIFGLGSSNAYSSKGLYSDNVKYSDNVEFYGVEDLSIKYSGGLSQLGDSYYLTFDVVNDTGVDVVITDYVYHEDDPYITYSLTYENGDKVKVGDILSKGEVKTIKYTALYENPVLDDSYEVDSSFNILYDQKI